METEPAYKDSVPKEFLGNPFGYFETRGKNIRSGDPKTDADGRVRDDPSAVKELPAWNMPSGEKLHTVAKKINTEKGEVGKSGDPFYEYHIMESVHELGLPAPTLVAKIQQDGAYLFVVKKVPGVSWHQRDTLNFKERGYSQEDIDQLTKQAEQQVRNLHHRFEEAGIYRDWKLKDMIFDIDIEGKKLKCVTPTDWERTRIDQEKFSKYKAGLKEHS